MAEQQQLLPLEAAHGDARQARGMHLDKCSCILIIAVGTASVLLPIMWHMEHVDMIVVLLRDCVTFVQFAMYFAYDLQSVWPMMWKVCAALYYMEGFKLCVSTHAKFGKMLILAGLLADMPLKFKCNVGTFCSQYWCKKWLLRTCVNAARVIGTCGMITVSMSFWIVIECWLLDDKSYDMSMSKITEIGLNVIAATQAICWAYWYACECSTRCSWKDKVQKAEIAWIRCRALRSWAEHPDGRLIRRQEVPCTDFVLESDAHAGWWGKCCWCACGSEKRRRFVMSHAWLSKAHPDPDGLHLKELVAELSRVGANDEDVVFVDFCSLYQTNLSHPDALALEGTGERLPDGHPSLRTPEQNEAFHRAMCMMHELYTFSATEVLIVPSVPEDALNHTPYLARGWCFFEFAISADHWRLANAANPTVTNLLDSSGAPWVQSDFEAEFAQKHFTNKGDSKTVLNLYRKLYEEEPGRTAREAWLQMAKLTLIFVMFLHCSVLRRTHFSLQSRACSSMAMS